MRRTCRFTAAVWPLLITILLLAPGCSSDRPLDPAAALPAADESSTTLLATPVVPVDTLTFVETFDDKSNVGDWSYFTTHDATIETDGGNPGWYLHDASVVSFAPHPGSGLGVTSVFAGNYREQRVLSVGIDLRSFDYDLDVSSRYLTLLVMNDGGTPDDAIDDRGAYFIGPVKVPSKYVEMKSDADKNVAGWVSYAFEIASQSNAYPAGWTAFSYATGASAKPRDSWRQLMESVSYIQFWYGDPTQYYLLDSYDLGLDNPRISREVAR